MIFKIYIDPYNNRLFDPIYNRRHQKPNHNFRPFRGEVDDPPDIYSSQLADTDSPISGWP